MCLFPQGALCLCGGPGRRGDDVDPTSLPIEGHDAVGEGEQGVVLAATDVAARVIARPALADDDAAGANGFATVDLDAEALAVRFPVVAGRALALLVCHV